jgi:hypothetical protein
MEADFGSPNEKMAATITEVSWSISRCEKKTENWPTGQGRKVETGKAVRFLHWLSQDRHDQPWNRA